MFFFSFNHPKYTIHNTKYRFLAQSLLEALLSITLGVILIGGSVGLIGVSLKTFNTAKQHLQANSLMRQTAEIIQSLARDNWHNISDLYPGVHYKLAKQGNAYAIQKGEEKIFDSQGLVSYWSFDEATSTIAYDNQGNNNGILVNGPTWQSPSNCVSGSCLSFDGSTQYVRVSTSDFQRSNGQALTVAVWIKPFRLGGQYQTIVANRSAAYYNWMLYQHTTDGSIQLHGAQQYKSTYIPTIGTWVYIVATVDTLGNYNLYANGQVVQTVSGYQYNAQTPNELSIGNFDSTEYYQGLIDELRIYNRALSADEIKAQYLAGLDKLGLVSYWALDENGANTAYDSQSTNNGTLINGPTWQSPANCVSGSCLSFDGVDDYVSTLLNPSTELGQEITMEAWVYPYSQSNYRGVMGQHGGTYQGLIGFQYENGYWNFGYGDGSSWKRNTNMTLTLNTWTHLTGVIKAGTGGYIKVYKNGVEITPQTNVSTAISHLTVFDIGRAYSAADRYFNGLIDEVRIYNRALSAEEIAQRYQASYTKYFVTNKVSRTSGNIDTTTYNSANDDPSTLKINSVVKYGRGLVSQQTGGIADLRFYLTRSYNNQVFQQTDWSGGSGQTGPISNPGNKFETADANINYASTTGSIYMTTATTTEASLTSSILDTGVSGGAGFNSLLWQGSLGTGGTVKFQIAFSNSSSGPWTYYGPTSTSDYYQPNPNVSVAFPTTGPASPQNMRYIRYKVYLSTTGTTPKIDDIIINWSP